MEKVTYTNTFFMVELDANHNGVIMYSSKSIVFSILDINPIMIKSCFEVLHTN